MGKRSLTDQNYILSLVRKLRENIKEKSSNSEEEGINSIDNNIEETDVVHDKREAISAADNKVNDDIKIGNFNNIYKYW